MKKIEDSVVLVTGATGLIGSNLVERLLDLGAYVIAVGRSKDKLEKCFALNPHYSRLNIIEHDMSQRLPDFKEKIDYIFHAASPIAGNIIKTNPVSVILPNLIGTLNCLDLLKNQEKKDGIRGRIIIFSSATVYGMDNSSRTVFEDDTTLADSLDAINAPYSESKRMIEVLAKAYSKEYNVSTVIARLAYVYGYTYFMPNTAFYEFIQDALHGRDIVLNSNCAPKRDNIYVKDAVEGLLAIAQYGKDGESYNVSSNGDGNNYLAVDELAHIIASNAKYNIRVTFSNIVPGDRKPGICQNNDKIKELGWTVKYNIQSGICETLQLYMKELH